MWEVLLVPGFCQSVNHKRFDSIHDATRIFELSQNTGAFQVDEFGMLFCGFYKFLHRLGLGIVPSR